MLAGEEDVFHVLEALTHLYLAHLKKHMILQTERDKW